MADIFVSYKRTQRPIVALLAKILEAHGWSVWFDAQIDEGTRFRTEIERELGAARCCVVLWCDDAITADFVVDEANWAKTQGALVQARLSKVTPPLGFRQQQLVELLGWQRGVTPDILKLIAAIERIIGPPGEPVRGPMGTPPPAARTTDLASPPIDPTLPRHLSILLEQALADVSAEHTRFDLRLLHPRIRIAAEVARRAEFGAITAQHRALHAAEVAEEAARRARHQMEGYVSQAKGKEARQRFEGETPTPKRPYRGVYAFEDPDSKYAGEFIDGNFSGVGVRVYGSNIADLRYEGEYTNDQLNGLGVYCWTDGDRHLGTNVASASQGPGVFHFADGNRYEGEFVGNDRNGLGALWDADGRLVGAGVWREGQLVEELNRN